MAPTGKAAKKGAVSLRRSNRVRATAGDKASSPLPSPPTSPDSGEASSPSSLPTTQQSNPTEKDQPTGSLKREADDDEDWGLEQAPKRQRRNAAKTSSNQRSTVQVEPLLDSRLPSCGKPEVWADDRPELCETLPYYNAWQGSSSTRDGYVRGMLLDNDTGGRSYMGEEVVFARAGGGCGTDDSGAKGQVKDHDSNNARIRSFYNNMEDKIPLILIVGDNNAQCPSVVPHKYCVMGHFQVTDIWAEKLSGKVAFYFRLEKLDLASKSWWAPIGTPEPLASRDFETKALRQQCTKCAKTSPQVFVQGWMCLNENCSMLWTLDDVEAPAALDYNPDFLNERTSWDGFVAPFAITPSLPFPEKHERGFSMTEACTKGIVCLQCGRCIARRHFDNWRCQTVGCGFTYSLPREPIAAASLIGNVNDRYEGHAIPEDKVHAPSISRTLGTCGLFRIHTYGFPPNNTIIHMFSNETINKAPGGPDDIFWRLQEVEFGLQRFPMSMSVVSGQLTKHFAQNFGLPYKYIVNVDCKAFSEAPADALEAVRRMSWAAQHTSTDGSFEPFNELLVVAYMETSKMGYHDDGEDTLKPTVATFSLGAPGTMRFRLKMKYYTGFTDKDKKNYDPTLPVIDGCWNPEERRRLNALSRTPGMTKAKLSAEAKVALKGFKGQPPVVLDLRLKHGDILVMNGAELQKYYEHEASPMEGLRFCLTCRGIKPEMLPADQLWKGELPEGFNDPANAYDGDLALYENYRQRTIPSPPASPAKNPFVRPHPAEIKSDTGDVKDESA